MPIMNAPKLHALQADITTLAVDVIVNPEALGLLHRDVINVATWVGRHGVQIDAERVFGQLLSLMW